MPPSTYKICPLTKSDAADAKNFVSMIPSEPELGGVLRNTAKELLTSVLPGKS